MLRLQEGVEQVLDQDYLADLEANRDRLLEQIQVAYKKPEQRMKLLGWLNTVEIKIESLKIKIKTG